MSEKVLSKAKLERYYRGGLYEHIYDSHEALRAENAKLWAVVKDTKDMLLAIPAYLRISEVRRALEIIDDAAIDNLESGE